MGRVMHEFKHGELKSGPGGKAGKVKSRRQAIAIALKEAGASKYESESENNRNLAKSERKEARGDTYQQEREGKSHVGAADGEKAAPLWAERMRRGRRREDANLRVRVRVK
jgi:type IV secretory pathway TrbL component